MTNNTQIDQQRLDDVVRVFAELTEKNLTVSLGSIFHPQARFKDPFNDVIGIEAIEKIFAHGFAQCPGMRFVIEHSALAGHRGFVQWYFLCHPERSQPARQIRIDGVSVLTFDAEGLVVKHEDFWDPAAQIYERIPVFGALLRWLRKRLAAC